MLLDQEQIFQDFVNECVSCCFAKESPSLDRVYSKGKVEIWFYDDTTRAIELMLDERSAKIIRIVLALCSDDSFEDDLQKMGFSSDLIEEDDEAIAYRRLKEFVLSYLESGSFERLPDLDSDLLNAIPEHPPFLLETAFESLLDSKSWKTLGTILLIYSDDPL